MKPGKTFTRMLAEVLSKKAPLSQSRVSVRTTPAERKYFEELLSNKANREELLESVPSFKMIDGKIDVSIHDRGRLAEFIDQTVVFERGQTRLPPGFYNDQTAKRMFKDNPAPHDRARLPRDIAEKYSIPGLLGSGLAGGVAYSPRDSVAAPLTASDYIDYGSGDRIEPDEFPRLHRAGEFLSNIETPIPLMEKPFEGVGNYLRNFGTKRDAKKRLADALMAAGDVM